MIARVHRLVPHQRFRSQYGITRRYNVVYHLSYPLPSVNLHFTYFYDHASPLVPGSCPGVGHACLPRVWSVLDFRAGARTLTGLRDAPAWFASHPARADPGLSRRPSLGGFLQSFSGLSPTQYPRFTQLFVLVRLAIFSIGTPDASTDYRNLIN